MASRRQVEEQIAIRAQPEAVIRAFLEEAAIRCWWGAERALIEPHIGGVYAVTWEASEQGYRYVTSGVIRALQRERYLFIDHLLYFNPQRQILGPMRLSVEAVAVRGSGSVLRVLQDGYATGGDWDWYYEAVRDAWPAVLRSVRDFLQDGKAFC